ncbi:F subunit of K+-transporting ATPase [Sphingomonas dokdonensis]|nr:F subunit of K+-transporting ATPase [Sphingomonas dokdonensis]
MLDCATNREDAIMTLDLWLAAITALGLLLYLVAVLIRPERF